MEFIAKKNYYLIVPLRAFLTILIFPDINFTNLKQYSLTKWSQLSGMTVDKIFFLQVVRYVLTEMKQLIPK